MISATRILKFATFATLLCFTANITLAQEKLKFKYDVSAAQTKYVYQQTLDVGDMTGHQVRMYDIERIFGDNGPVFQGVKVVKDNNRGFGDAISGNGPSWGYGVLTLENGDKIFVRFSGSISSVEGENGARQSTYNGSGVYTGGTGAFKGIRGTIRNVSHIQFKDGKVVNNQSENDVEYWFEK